MAERVPPGHDSASAGDHAFYWRLSVRRRRSTVHDGVGLSDNFHHRHTAFSVLVRTSISSRLLYCGQFASHTNEDITSDICSISFRFCASFPSVLSAVFRAVPSPPLCYQSHQDELQPLKKSCYPDHGRHGSWRLRHYRHPQAAAQQPPQIAGGPQLSGAARLLPPPPGFLFDLRNHERTKQTILLPPRSTAMIHLPTSLLYDQRTRHTTHDDCPERHRIS